MVLGSEHPLFLLLPGSLEDLMIWFHHISFLLLTREAASEWKGGAEGAREERGSEGAREQGSEKGARRERGSEVRDAGRKGRGGRERRGVWEGGR